MGQSIIRKPRPMGLTQMSLRYQEEQKEELLVNLYTYLINQWYTNTGVVCGTQYDINSFAYRFGIPKPFISTYMMETVCNSRIMDLEKQSQVIEGLISEQITWALEDRMEIVNQLNLLKQSQNGKYTPFITAEVNKALKLRLESSTSLQTLVRALTGSGNGSINIFNQFNQQNNTETVEAQFVTIEEARDLIQQVCLPTNKSDELKYIEAQYDFKELPEVVATKQQGVDISKEGISINKTELNAITDNYKGSIESSAKEHHEFRREIEERIDPDEEDPELEIYDTEEDTHKENTFSSSQFLL